VNKKVKAKVKTINRGEELWIEGIWTGSVAFLAGFAGLYFGSMGLFRMGIPMGFWSSALFILPALAVCLVMQPGRFGMLIFGAQVLAIAFCILLALPFHDLSWDGMAVRQILVEGVLLRKLCPEVLPSTHLLSAWLGLLGGSVDAGKAANPLLMICAFGFGLKAVTEAGFQGLTRWLIALVAAMNPVSIYQLSSFYLDGALASLISCQLAAFFLVYLKPKHLPFLGSSLFCFLMLCTAKTSGFAYGGILALGIMLLLATSRRLALSKIITWHLFLIFLGLATHILERGSGYNWLRLKQQTDLKTYLYGVGSAPDEIRNLNKFQAFLKSHLSPSAVWPNAWEVKFPLVFSRPELAVYQDLNPDLRSGGFGPLYGTFLLLACIGSLLVAFQRKIPWQSCVPAVLVFSTCLLSQAWWARWVPQAWLIPLLMVVPVLFYCPKGLSEWVSLGSLAVGLVNSLLILVFYVSGCLENRKLLEGQIQFLKKLPSPVEIWVPDFPSNLTWLQQEGISFNKLEKEPETPRLKLQRTTSKVDLPKNWRQFLGREQIVESWRKRGLIED